ncbi:ladderlectin-like [Megalobrama amblycephala]|uniref:ladderlectin-like n=1 Tax=Megalobrama amblycephala TaxID=75352 RepID=UPI002013F171|nr:ladderlectin-like [Megalobrama amblycephala]XP_048039428.1 ladderlectin-like [Megalobrama amblycephala]
MALWTLYLSLGLLVALNASVETRPFGNKRCGVCQTGWTSYGCRCFKFFSSQYTWARAEKFCLNYDGNLASVHSHGEYMFIQNLIKHQSSWIWIGGYDAVEEGVWLWSDGSQMMYTIWSPGNPNNIGGNQNCLEMHSGSTDWNDDKCDNKKPFVCVH